jgi:predicted dehydrogenase
LEIVSSGEIGSIMFLRGRYGHGGRIGYEKEWRANKSESGGGELIDQCTHLLDLSIGFLGAVQLEYAAIPTYFWKMPVEDNAFILVKNLRGSIAFLHASCTEWKNMFSFEVYGEGGKLDINGLGNSYGTETLTLHKVPPEMGPPISETWTFTEEDKSWEVELSDFIYDIENGTNRSDNVSSSLEVLRVIGEIYQGVNK